MRTFVPARHRIGGTLCPLGTGLAELCARSALGWQDLGRFDDVRRGACGASGRWSCCWWRSRCPVPATPAHAADGDFIRSTPRTERRGLSDGRRRADLRELVGVGGGQQRAALHGSHSGAFRQPPAVPADGTVTNDAVQTYRWVGGAPSWSRTGPTSTVRSPRRGSIPARSARPGPGAGAACARSRSTAPRSSADCPATPRTAPPSSSSAGRRSTSSSWDAVGGARAPTVIDMVAIRNAGNGQVWFNHLNYRPTEGTQLHAGGTC